VALVCTFAFLILHFCMLFFSLFAFAPLASPLPTLESASAAARYREHLSSTDATDKCFSRAYASFDAVDCFANTATANHNHAARLALCHHAAFNRSVDEGSELFFHTATAFALREFRREPTPRTEKTTTPKNRPYLPPPKP